MIETIEHVSLRMPVEIAGTDGKALSQFFRESVKASRDYHVRADLLITSQRVIITPSGRNQGGLLMLGALLGPLGIGAGILANGIGDKVAELKNAKVDARQKFKEEDLARCVVWDRQALSFRVFEQRESWDIFGGEWATYPEFSGPCRYQEQAYDVAISFPIHGKFKGALKANPKKALPIMACFDYSIDQVTKR